jgi:hypothetical protein
MALDSGADGLVTGAVAGGVVGSRGGWVGAAGGAAIGGAIGAVAGFYSGMARGIINNSFDSPFPDWVQAQLDSIRKSVNMTISDIMLEILVNSIGACGALATFYFLSKVGIFDVFSKITKTQLFAYSFLLASFGSIVRWLFPH